MASWAVSHLYCLNRNQFSCHSKSHSAENIMNYLKKSRVMAVTYIGGGIVWTQSAIRIESREHATGVSKKV